MKAVMVVCRTVMESRGDIGNSTTHLSLGDLGVLKEVFVSKK